jgi:hypothetical protein
VIHFISIYAIVDGYIWCLMAINMHAIGVPEGVTLLEYEQEQPEEQQIAQEQDVQMAEGEANEEDLPVCPDHQPALFLKGKPRSIISLPCFTKS